MNQLAALCADVDAPLDVRLSAPQVGDGVSTRDLTFAGARADRVSAYLAEPAGDAARPPRAGVLFMHWGFGSRDSFLAEARAWSRAGAACMTLDAPHCGQRGRGLPALGQVDTARAMIGATVTEVRRGLRVLQEEGGVDPARIAYVGHSFGATLAPHVAALEPALRTVVAMAGAPRFAGVWSLWPDSRYRAALAPLDGVAFLPATGMPWLLQFGSRDEFIEHGWAKEMQAAAPTASKAVWYDADHALNAAALRERTQWLAQQLGMAVVDAGWDACPPAHELRAYRRAAPMIRVVRAMARLCGRG